MGYNANGDGRLMMKKELRNEIEKKLSEYGFETYAGACSTVGAPEGYESVEVCYPDDRFHSDAIDEIFDWLTEDGRVVDGRIDFEGDDGERWSYEFFEEAWNERDLRSCSRIGDFGRSEEEKRVIGEALEEWAKNHPEDAGTVEKILA